MIIKLHWLNPPLRSWSFSSRVLLRTIELSRGLPPAHYFLAWVQLNLPNGHHEDQHCETIIQGGKVFLIGCPHTRWFILIRIQKIWEKFFADLHSKPALTKEKTTTNTCQNLQMNNQINHNQDFQTLNIEQTKILTSSKSLERHLLSP